MRGKILRVTILAVWLGLLAVAWQRASEQLHDAGDASASLASAPQDGVRDEWMAIYQGGQRIGFTHRTLDTTANTSALFEESFLRLKVLEAQRQVRTLVHAELDGGFALRRADFSLHSDGTYFTANAEVNESTLTVKLDLDGTLSTHRMELTEPLYLPQSLRASLSPASLQEGQEMRVQVWDPVLSKNHDLITRVVRRETIPDRQPPVIGWRLEEETHGVTTTAWLDDSGEVLREEGPLGLVLVRVRRDEALADVQTAASMDVAQRAAVPVGNIADARSRQRLRLRVRGTDRVVEDGEQSRQGEVLTIQRSPLQAADTYQLPYRGGLEEELKATLFLQSDHRRVRTLAREILAEEADAQRAAQHLNNWVHAFVDKSPTLSVPNALQVIDSGRGDCNEHAVLLAALARSVGLPARVVAGLVYLDGAFLYHAWCEVWLGRWVTADPALGQLPADATHLKLVEGDPDQHAVLLGLVDKLRIEVVE